MLLDNNNFQEYFNGIVIGLQSTASPLMMQLNFSGGRIQIEYDFKELILIEGGDAANAEDMNPNPVRQFTILTWWVRFNTITQTMASAEVQMALDGNDNGNTFTSKVDSELFLILIYLQVRQEKYSCRHFKITRG